MSDKKQELEQLKASTDIVEVVEKYLPIKKIGANYKTNCPVHSEKSASFTVSPAKQIFHCFGCGVGGTALDFIMLMEKCELPKAIEILKDFHGWDIERPTVTVRKEVPTQKFSYHQLGLFSKNDLSAVSPYLPIEFETDDATWLQIKEPFVKLFETNKLPLDFKARLDYIYKNILGYDTFFKSPSIILRDRTGKVVDKCAYRPNKPDSWETFDGKAKYFYKNSEFRGNDWLYPFQLEMEKLLTKDKSFIVGEGLKNALNAYLHGMAYISLESASVDASEALITYVLDLLSKGYKVIAFFDADKAGQRAFERFKEDSNLHDLENAISFDAGIDFAEYVVGAENE